ncbi:MAG: bifunctional adenosylcobinamide kinase/adenosylcobinamide-phosphate guanylyltransferase [Nitrospira sp. CR1.3]|nr:bifunctional adenosylcobinamide kinase/adenosylcobinamide-phosphate guanylyltransferase [Nitrospira sp. CR1.3]
MTTKSRASRLVFVLGGASSGKSDVALRLAAKGIGKTAPRAFVATGEGRDEEMAAKIARHRLSRSAAWTTAEVPTDLTGWLEKHGKEFRVIVVDCLTMWLSNHFGLGSKESQVLHDMLAFIHAVKRMRARVILVANELGMGVVPVDATSRRFRELAGAVNRLVAKEADEAYLVASGLSIRLK